MERMFEQGVGIKAIASVIIKPVLAGLIALGWWPASDFIILQIDNSVLLSPTVKVIMEELKIILGVMISFVVLVKIIAGLIKLYPGKKL